MGEDLEPTWPGVHSTGRFQVVMDSKQTEDLDEITGASCPASIADHVVPYVCTTENPASMSRYCYRHARACYRWAYLPDIHL